MNLLQTLVNSPYLGVGGTRGLARLSRLAGHGLNFLDRISANGAYMGIGRNQVGRYLDETLFGQTHGLLAGQLKRMQLDKALQSMSDSQLSRVISAARSVVAKRALQPGDDKMIWQLFNIGAATNPTRDSRIYRRVPKKVVKDAEQIYNTQRYGSYGGFKPAMQDADYSLPMGAAESLEFAPYKEGNVGPYTRTKLLKLKRSPEPGKSVYLGVHDNGGGVLNVEDPYNAASFATGMPTREGAETLVRGLAGGGPKGTTASANILDRLPGYAERQGLDFYLPGATEGYWGNLLGEQKKVPKIVGVNRSGFWNWPEIADAHRLNFGERTVISSGDHSAGMDILKRHRDLMNARFRIMKQLGYFDDLRDLPKLPDLDPNDMDMTAWQGIGNIGRMATEQLIDKRQAGVQELRGMYDNRTLRSHLVEQLKDRLPKGTSMREIRRQAREAAELFKPGLDPLEGELNYTSGLAR